MPVVKIDKISDKSSVVLWKVTEDLSELNNLGQKEGIVPPEQDIHNDVKKMEWIAGRLALKKLVQSEGLHYQGIVKDEYGKPHLQNLNGEISLTHSFPYVGAIFHLDTIVGIDLEQPKTKMVNIATKFLSDAEMKNAGNSIDKICVYWCAKEALYKLYGKKRLIFKQQLPIEPFHLADDFELIGSIVVNNTIHKHNLRAIRFNGNYLVYTLD